MAAVFSQSMRTLAADKGWLSSTSLFIFFAFLGFWSAWFLYAQVTVYAVTEDARLEVDPAGHPIATSVTGRIVMTHLAVGREVQSGEVLAELDAHGARLQHEEARARLTALRVQCNARLQEIRAEEVAREDERRAARVTLDEAAARYREADIVAQAAAERAAIFARLHRRGLSPELERLRTKAEADEKRAAAKVLSLTISRLQSERRTQDSDRTARLTQLHRQLIQIDGDIQMAEATLIRLADTIDQSRIRAPIKGHLGEIANLQPGAVVQRGDTLGVVLPASPLQVVAYFPPASALGRVQSGQLARLKLESFPWAQYGSLATTVDSVAHEPRNGMIRVELRLDSEKRTSLPLQHGLPGTVEVEVERVSPATLVLQAVGKHFQRVHTKRGSS